MEAEDKELLQEIVGENPENADSYNIRKNGKKIERKVNPNINIISKEDNSGIDIYVKEDTLFGTVNIPVIITESGLKDVVYNDFHIGKNANIIIVAGCGITNNGHWDAQHDGIHRFYLEEGAKVKYIERHCGLGVGDGKKVLNPVTEIHMAKGSYMVMDTTQIKGVDDTIRTTKAELDSDATLVITEKILTSKNQQAKTEFVVNLKGEGQVKAVPEIFAKNVDANLIHEAAIGKIAGEQLMKLMSLGLSEKEAEEVIVNGFLK